MNTATAYKWRITNAKYIYITDEDLISPFIYNMSTETRVYPSGITYSGEYDYVDEVLIKKNVSSFTEEQYKDAFEKMSALLKTDSDGKYLQLLDYTAYMDDLECCSENATDVTCNPMDIFFTTKTETYPAGDKAAVYIDQITDEVLSDGGKKRTFDLVFGIPEGAQGAQGVDGMSAYKIALKDGIIPSGVTEEQWILEYVYGPQGADGKPGKDGDTPTIADTNKHWIINGEDTGVVAEGKDGAAGVETIDNAEYGVQYNQLIYDNNDPSKLNEINQAYVTVEQDEQDAIDIITYNPTNKRNSYELHKLMNITYQIGSEEEQTVDFYRSIDDNDLRYKDYYYTRSVTRIGVVTRIGFEYHFYDNSSLDDKLIFTIAERSISKFGYIDTGLSGLSTLGKVDVEDGVINYASSPFSDRVSVNVNSYSLVKESTETTVKDNLVLNRFNSLTNLYGNKNTTEDGCYSKRFENERKFSNYTHAIKKTNEDILIEESSSDISNGTCCDNAYGIVEASSKYSSNTYHAYVKAETRVEPHAGEDGKGTGTTVVNIYSHSNTSGTNNKENCKVYIDTPLTQMTGIATAKVGGVSDVYLGCPIGTIVMWAGLVIPDGWMLCDGTKIYVKETNSTSYPAFKIGNKYYIASNTDYEDLAYVVRGTYGIGSDNDYISIPDLRRQFPLGAQADSYIDGTEWHTALGEYGGETTHTLTVEEIPEHKHYLWGDSSGDTTNYVALNKNTGLGQVYHSGDIYSCSWHGNDDYRNTQFKAVNTGTVRTENGKTTETSKQHNNIPPYLALNFIIKYK